MEETKQTLMLCVKDFSVSPGPRYANQGNNDSGEDFYHSILNAKFYEAIKTNKVLVVDLDGVDGYMSSFLDEAFGNLVYDFGLDNIREYLDIVSKEEPEWIEMIQNDTFSDWSNRRNKQDLPKTTVEHKDWYFFDGEDYSTRNSSKKD